MQRKAAAADVPRPRVQLPSRTSPPSCPQTGREPVYLQTPPSSVSISLSSPGCSQTSPPNSSMPDDEEVSGIAAAVASAACCCCWQGYEDVCSILPPPPRLYGLCPAGVYPRWTDSPPITLQSTFSKKNNKKNRGGSPQELQDGWKTEVEGGE